MPEIVHGFIFDMDNTLYTNHDYSIHQEQVLVNRLAQEMGIGQTDCQSRVDQWRNNQAAANGGRRPSLGTSFCHFGIPIATSIEWRRQLITPELYLKPDPALAYCLEQGFGRIRLAVVTNNPVETACRTFKALGINPAVFVAIIGLDTTGVSKPDPAAFQLASQYLDCPPEKTVSLGDRFEIDLEPALQLGMGAILVEHSNEILDLPRRLFSADKSPI